MATLVSGAAGTNSILPAEYGQLVIRPLETLSLAFDSSLATVQRTSGRTWRVPVVLRDPSAAWLEEGQEIDPDNPELGEVEVTPSKVGGLSVITRELANDSSPAAQEIVGTGLARDIARQVDQAFTGNLDAPAPGGLESVADVHQVTGALDNLDALAEAVAALEGSGYAASGFLTDPATGLKLAQLKTGDGSNVPMLGDARQVMQRPVRVSPHVSPGVVWAVDSSMVHCVLREDVELAVSEDAYFSSDRIGVRALMRIGFAWPDPSAVAKVTLTTEDDEG